MYPQCLFGIENKKIRYTPAYPSFTKQKWGLRGYTLHGLVFMMLFKEINVVFLFRRLSGKFVFKKCIVLHFRSAFSMAKNPNI